MRLLAFAGFDVYSSDCDDSSQLISPAITHSSSPTSNPIYDFPPAARIPRGIHGNNTDLHPPQTGPPPGRAGVQQSPSDQTRSKSHSPIARDALVISSELACVGLANGPCFFSLFILSELSLRFIPCYCP